MTANKSNQRAVVRVCPWGSAGELSSRRAQKPRGATRSPCAFHVAQTPCPPVILGRRQDELNVAASDDCEGAYVFTTLG